MSEDQPKYNRDVPPPPEEQTSGLNFGAAIVALKSGKCVLRAEWKSNGSFIFMQVPASISGDIVPKMQSLPQSVKDEFIRRRGIQDTDGIKKAVDIHYKNQLAMVYPDNTIYGWVASPSDVLENDWCILD